MKNSLIVITTDFSSKDYYTGLMKGVILNIAPEAKIIDLCNDIAPQNIREAAFILMNSVTYFPKGTIFLMVVDPVVGTSRKPVAVKTKNYYFVAPDNGVLSWVLENEEIEEIIVLDKPEYQLKNISSTFHGRDIFAPAAAYLAKGKDISELGNKIDFLSLKQIPELKCVITKDKISGEIIRADSFGNLITSLHKDIIKKFHKGKKPENLIIEINGKKIKGISSTFSDVESGELVAYIGSAGYLEIAVRDGRARDIFGDLKEIKVNFYK